MDSEFWKKREAREASEAIHDGGPRDGDWYGIPRCPWCGAGDHDWWDGSASILRHDGDEAEVECGQCEKKYMAVMCIETTFRAWRKP